MCRCAFNASRRFSVPHRFVKSMWWAPVQRKRKSPLRKLSACAAAHTLTRCAFPHFISHRHVAHTIRLLQFRSEVFQRPLIPCSARRGCGVGGQGSCRRPPQRVWANCWISSQPGDRNRLSPPPFANPTRRLTLRGPPHGQPRGAFFLSLGTASCSQGVGGRGGRVNVTVRPRRPCRHSHRQKRRKNRPRLRDLQRSCS